MAQTVKHLSTMWETWVWSLGWEDLLEEGMATHAKTLAWRSPMDRGAWRATVHRITQSQTQLKWLGTHTPVQVYRDLGGKITLLPWDARSSPNQGWKQKVYIIKNIRPLPLSRQRKQLPNIQSTITKRIYNIFKFYFGWKQVMRLWRKNEQEMKTITQWTLGRLNSCLRK